MRWPLFLLAFLLLGCPTTDDTDDDGDDDSGDSSDDDTGDDDIGDDDTGDDDTGDDDTGDDDTSFELGPGTHEDSYGDRGYILHLPPAYDPSTPIPLVLGFHGAGDDADNFFDTAAYTGWIDAAAPARFALLIPDTLSPFADFAVWSGNPTDDMDEMLDEMDSVLELVGYLSDHAQLDPHRVHAFGFSDGGLFLAVAGLTRADQLATLTVTGYGWGGFYPNGPPPRLAPVMFVCGTDDNFYSYAQQSEGYLSGHGHTTRFDSVSGAGHQFSALMSHTTPDDVWAWIGTHELP